MHTHIIAEAGVNHNGDLAIARRLVDAAVSAGADAVKFQTFRAETLVTATAEQAQYQIRNIGAEQSQYQMLKTLELKRDEYRELQNYCQERGIEFLSTPFDIDSLDFLVDELGLTRIKLSSGDLTHAPLLLASARKGVDVIISTGMAHLAELEQALAVLAYGYQNVKGSPTREDLLHSLASPTGRELIRQRVSVLQCTTEYPAPVESANLMAMDTMHQAFGVRTGFSDHTVGIAVAIAAVARGASIIEKHFTLDREMQGPDHKASLEVDELRSMIEGIRQVELAIGDGMKLPHDSELANLKVARKSLVAAVPVKAGETWTEHNLSIKRPGDGISPFAYWEMLGTIANRDYVQDEQLEY
ncbi:MAG: N-acetylneuraminate synthase [Gammaproteobacteria bacterium]|nr:N-acetylneuraminate synthase [Gammaproteobacteria bacterium]